MKLNHKFKASSHFLKLNQVFLLFLIKQVKMWYRTRQAKMLRLQLKSMKLLLISNPTLTQNSVLRAPSSKKSITKLKTLFLELKNPNKPSKLKSLTKNNHIIITKSYHQILKEKIFQLYMKYLWTKRRQWTKKPQQPLTNAKKIATHLPQSTKNQFKALIHIKICKKLHILLLCLSKILCNRCFKNHKCQLLICMKLTGILSVSQIALK